MTAFYELSARNRELLLLLCALTLLLVLCLMILRFQRLRFPRFLWPEGPAAAALYILLSCLGAADRQLLRPRFMPYLSPCARLPVLPLGAALWLLFVLAVWALLRELRVERGEITPFSIKEALDDLPTGVCFSVEGDGAPLLVNRRMDALARELTGRELRDADALWAALPACPAVQPEGGGWLFRQADGGVWSFRRERVCGGHSVFNQTTAADETDLFALTEKLREENAALAEMSERLHRLTRDVTRLSREEEILAMKARVHDDIGRSVLATRRFLVQRRPLAEAAPVAGLWRSALGLLQNELEARDDDMLAQLLDAAGVLGVRVELAGALPADQNAGYLLLCAVRECVTNAARHAQADLVRAELRERDGFAQAVITNNGAPPSGPIREGGGLGSLRRRLENAGGEMEIAARPVFVLTARVPVKKEGAEQ